MNIRKVKRFFKYLNLSNDSFFTKTRGVQIKIGKIVLTYRKKSIQFISDRETVEFSLKWGRKIIFSL